MIILYFTVIKVKSCRMAVAAASATAFFLVSGQYLLLLIKNLTDFSSQEKIKLAVNNIFF